MRVLEDIYYTQERNEMQMLDVYLPDGRPDAVFMFMHGGGLTRGSRKKCMEHVPQYMTKEGIAVVSVEYRMYPDAVYPDFIDDAVYAIKWIIDNKESVFGGFDELYVGGSSAGGYMSMMLCFAPEFLAKVGLDNSVISGYFHDAGQPTAHFEVLNRMGEDSRRVVVDERAPLYYIGQLPSYPRMRFIVSDNDMACRLEQTMLVMATLRHFGYEGFDYQLKHGKHTHYTRLLDENGESVYGRMITDFIKNRTEQ